MGRGSRKERTSKPQLYGRDHRNTYQRKDRRAFEEFGVFTKAELESRKEIKYEAYAKAINIEARTMLDIAGKQIIPTVIKYTKQLADSINAVVAAGILEVEVQTDLLSETSALLKENKKMP